jgi:hypothetical protein
VSSPYPLILNYQLPILSLQNSKPVQYSFHLSHHIPVAKPQSPLWERLLIIRLELTGPLQESSSMNLHFIYLYLKQEI